MKSSLTRSWIDETITLQLESGSIREFLQKPDKRKITFTGQLESGYIKEFL